MTLFNFLLIFINTLILVTGQFLWKFGMESKAHAFDSITAIIKMFLSPFILSGLAMYGVATVLWLFILTRVSLSIAYPIQSIAYVLAVFGAYFIFNEPLTISKVMGCVLIMGGVSLIGFGNN